MQPLNRLHLSGLRAVEAVARLGSLRAAAAELGVTPGAVSQQVARTEAALGRALFLRQPEGMQLTEAGAEVAPLLRAGFGQIAAAVARLDPGRGDLLTVSVAPILASRWLIWRLPGFQRAHPEVKVRIEADVALADPDRSDVDLCIRVGRGPYPGLRAEPLFRQRVAAVCAPDLAARFAGPADLARLPVIREPAPMFGWEVWLAPQGLADLQLGEGPVFSDASLCLDAAISGAGVFLAFEVVAADALERGTLVALPPGFVGTDLHYWLVTSGTRRPGPAARAFALWLRAELARSGFMA
ncbi:LysR substrate-binding domain-containing protein [Frigidibacter oleivorans]|uniref:LysR substrate-binding domain-containing protein n=1 Tax=Frigidibacter oleivorans TaxID=2487129 RepID=UPI000F8F45A2|nr:LysR substrate-binding domain-containing protein [Frigidibacter oleivorans]